MKERNLKVLKIHPKDTVLVALTHLKKGEPIIFESETYILKEDIEEKHKFFIKDLAKGMLITMYGITVGKIVIDNVSIGEKMTVTNTKHEADAYAYRNTNYFSKLSPNTSMVIKLFS